MRSIDYSVIDVIYKVTSSNHNRNKIFIIAIPSAFMVVDPDPIDPRLSIPIWSEHQEINMLLPSFQYSANQRFHTIYCFSYNDAAEICYLKKKYPNL
jgi:hypothetical protein